MTAVTTDKGGPSDWLFERHVASNYRDIVQFARTKEGALSLFSIAPAKIEYHDYAGLTPSGGGEELEAGEEHAESAPTMSERPISSRPGFLLLRCLCRPVFTTRKSSLTRGGPIIVGY
jgi:hypothetical protein